VVDVPISGTVYVVEELAADAGTADSLVMVEEPVVVTLIVVVLLPVTDNEVVVIVVPSCPLED